MGTRSSQRVSKPTNPKKVKKKERNAVEVPSRLVRMKKFIEMHKGAQKITLILMAVFGLQCAYLLKLFKLFEESNNDLTWASSNDIIPTKQAVVPCSSSYLEDIQAFSGCIPAQCGRVVADNVITSAEAEILLNLAKRGFAYGESDGGASILDFHSGALSKGKKFVNIYSLIKASELFHEEDITTYRSVRRKIQNLLASAFNISESALYLTHPTFFSFLTNKDAATVHDEYWHTHVDKETYKSFHYTSLLYLNNYGKDFTGGRFIFDELANYSTILEPKKARLSGFTSGWENPHHVERVTGGSRYAATISFTCNPKNAIKDPGFR
ncbi:unnamed protein product [Bemisia tabaci]|uniref:Fe2OG dioxygenase domain-containing protein n=1 Tax=Bemisia tabaci TaxID=7038 RepID=A0A9P0AF97_BEMTA|nr:unnamed protein product [Bemisia tabaci]